MRHDSGAAQPAGSPRITQHLQLYTWTGFIKRYVTLHCRLPRAEQMSAQPYSSWCWQMRACDATLQIDRTIAHTEHMSYNIEALVCKQLLLEELMQRVLL